MKKLISGLAVSSVMLFSTTIPLNNGWNLVGAVEDINISQTACVKTAWMYDQYTTMNSGWTLYTNTNYGYDTPSDYGYTEFDMITKSEGFWAYADASAGCSIVFPDVNTTTDNNTTVVDSNVSTFINPLTDVTSDMFANKTFKYYKSNENPHAPMELEYITFNSSAEYTDSVTGDACSYYPEDGVTVNVLAKVQDGKLQFLVNGTVQNEYKILASNTTGMVFGTTDIDNFDSNNSGMLPPEVFYLLNNDATETATDMSVKAPYKTYMFTMYNEANYDIYETNGTTVSYWDTGHSNPYPYTIENGAFFSQDDGSDISNTWTKIVQTMYSVGDFDINNQVNESRYYSSGGDKKSNGEDLNLTVEDITSWYEYLSITGNKYNGYTYSSNGGSTGILNDDVNHTYEISNGGLTLTLTDIYSCGSYSNSYHFDPDRTGTDTTEFRIYYPHGENSIGLNSQVPVIQAPQQN